MRIGVLHGNVCVMVDEVDHQKDGSFLKTQWALNGSLNSTVRKLIASYFSFPFIDPIKAQVTSA